MKSPVSERGLQLAISLPESFVAPRMSNAEHTSAGEFGDIQAQRGVRHRGDRKTDRGVETLTGVVMVNGGRRAGDENPGVADPELFSNLRQREAALIQPGGLSAFTCREFRLPCGDTGPASHLAHRPPVDAEPCR